MKGNVSGLLSMTRIKAIGKLQRSQIDTTATKGICPKGNGKKQITKPTKQAVDTEWRVKWKRLGSCSNLPKKRNREFCFSAWGSGDQRCINLRGMTGVAGSNTKEAGNPQWLHYAAKVSDRLGNELWLK